MASLTVISFVAKSHLLAKAFFAYGLVPGDYFSIYLPNSTEYHACTFGAWLCGATVSPADPDLADRVLAQQLEEIKPKMIVCHSGNLRKIVEALKSFESDTHVSIVVLSLANRTDYKAINVLSYSRLLRQAEEMPEIPGEVTDSYDPEQVGLLIWSAGTTGRPKAIQVYNKTIRWMLTEDLVGRKYLQTTCFHQLEGFFTPIQCLLQRASSCFIPTEAMEDPVSILVLFQAVEKFKPTTFMAGPYHVIRLANISPTFSREYNLNSLKVISPGASDMSLVSFDKLKLHFPRLTIVANWYNMAEFGNLISLSNSPKNLGFVYPGTEVKIADPKTEEPLPAKKVGEILVRCPYVMKGYLNRPEENAEFFGIDGFVHTGDLGHYDGDGMLYFDGKLKDVIKYQNAQISPVHIEAVLSTHPGVKEVGVFGLPSPGDDELVAAAVVKKEHANVSQTDLKNLVKIRLPKEKWLRGGVFFVDSLVRTPQGKLQRHKLFELIR